MLALGVSAPARARRGLVGRRHFEPVAARDWTSFWFLLSTDRLGWAHVAVLVSVT